MLSGETAVLLALVVMVIAAVFSTMLAMSAFGCKADMANVFADVCF